MAKLPRNGELLVERGKIVDYLLSEAHPDGKAKAQFFAARGFASDQWQIFAKALCWHGREREVEAETLTKFGTKYTLRCELVTPDGHNPCIFTVWIMEDDAPSRLVTAYPASG